jgi:hypothetical protein
MRLIVTTVLGFAGFAALGATMAAQPAAAQTTNASALSMVISEGLQAIAQMSLPFLIAMASIGVITMAVREVYAEFTWQHRKFNKQLFESWAHKRQADDAVIAQLIELATGGNDLALYSLSGAGLTAQVSMATRVALAFPTEFRRVLALLGGRLADTDITTLVTVTEEEQLRARRARVGEMDAGDDELEQQTRVQRLQDADQARTRLGHLIDRNLDALQIELTSGWERVNKNAAFVVSAALTILASFVYLVTSDYWTSRSWNEVAGIALLSIVAGVVAGFIAPVAKDLVTALESAKRR